MQRCRRSVKTASFTSLILSATLLPGCLGWIFAGDSNDPVVDFECALDSECAHLNDPLNPCIVGRCTAGDRVCEVQTVPDGTGCDDGDACNVGDTCISGSCTAGSARACDDGEACTVDGCDPSTGCTHLNQTGACDDGFSCTVGDSCVSGACEPGTNTCVCSSNPECVAFEDGDACNGTLICNISSSLCEVDPTTVVTCDTTSDPPCEVNTCNATTGLCAPQSQQDATSCDDGDACTSGDFCTGGNCISGTTMVCDDGSPCTDDSCAPATGCVAVNNGTCGGCVGLDCMDCNTGTNCAASGPFIGSTCCAEGDALQYLGFRSATHALDVEVDDTYAYVCTSFGLRITRITNPTSPQPAASDNVLCQRVALGPRLGGNTQVFYASHHGDDRGSPSIRTMRIDLVSGSMSEQHRINNTSVLFEGMQWSNGYLYSATHGSGVRVYQTNAQGIPTFVTAVSGFSNAWKIDIEGSTMVVADGEGGLKVVSLADPAVPTIIGSAPTIGIARDVDAAGGRAYVATGGYGLDVFDITTPTSPTLETNIDGQGSVQAVSVDGNLLALSSWSHVALHDATQFKLLATEDLQLYPSFDENLGIFILGDIVYAAEWEGLFILQHRPGLVGADIYFDVELLSYPADTSQSRALIVRNRGQIDLEVTNITVANPSRFAVDPVSLTVPPDGAGFVDVTYTVGSGASVQSQLIVATNDPDSGHNPFQMHLIASNSAALDVGDALPGSGSPNFDFLDPTGNGDVENLRGSVVLIAYFALF